jgi:hypothetical protein
MVKINEGQRQWKAIALYTGDLVFDPPEERPSIG